MSAPKAKPRAAKGAFTWSEIKAERLSPRRIATIRAKVEAEIETQKKLAAQKAKARK